MKKISIILSAILLTGCGQKLSMDYSSLDLKIELDKIFTYGNSYFTISFKDFLL